MRVLLLGGTAEARDLADRLLTKGIPCVSSLAGRVSSPRLPVGEVRRGGFGGVHGLAAYLRAEDITHIVDATHPFATTMTRNALDAGRRVGVPVLRYARPSWSSRPDAASWHWADTLPEVCRTAESLGDRPFICTGRQTLWAFAGWADRDVLVRVVEPLAEPVPPRWQVVKDRGPYDVAGEYALMQAHRIDVLLTKDSGGAYTSAKLDAAAALGVPVVVLRRPPPPPGLDEFSLVEACLAALDGAPGRDR